MRTIIYINDEICSSLVELKEILKNNSFNYRSVYEDIMLLHKDGILTQWLSEGASEEEQELCKKIREIPNDLSNTELIARLLCCILGEDFHLLETSFNDYLQIESTNIIANEIVYDFASYRLNYHSFRIQLRGSDAAISYIRLLLKVKKIDNEVITITVDDKYFDYCYTEIIYLKNFKLGETIVLDLPIHKLSDGLHFIEIKSASSLLVTYIFDVSRYRTLIEENWPNTEQSNFITNDYKGILWDIIRSSNETYIIGNHGHSSSYAGRYELDNILSIICEKQIYNDNLSYKDLIYELQSKGFELVSPPKYRYHHYKVYDKEFNYKVFNAIAQKIENPLVFTVVIENASDHSAKSMDNALNAKGNWVQVAVGLLENYPDYLKDEFTDRGILSSSIFNQTTHSSIGNNSSSYSPSSESSYSDDIPFYANEPYTG